jgi:hypothetical protein
MKTYEIYINREARTPQHKSYTERFVASPDPKREGLYKVSSYSSVDGYKQKRSKLFGKCNQQEIQEWILEMDEVA